MCVHVASVAQFSHEVLVANHTSETTPAPMLCLAVTLQTLRRTKSLWHNTNIAIYSEVKLEIKNTVYRETKMLQWYEFTERLIHQHGHYPTDGEEWGDICANLHLSHDFLLISYSKWKRRIHFLITLVFCKFPYFFQLWFFKKIQGVGLQMPAPMSTNRKCKKKPNIYKKLIKVPY